MTRTVPLTVQLGSGNAGLVIGYTVLDVDRIEYRAFTSAGVSESVIPGTYYVSGGVIVPDDGGYITIGEAGRVLLEVAIDPAGLSAQGTADALKLAPGAGEPAAGSVYDQLSNLPATILTMAVAAYAATPGTFGYLLSLLASLDFTAVHVVSASHAGEITIKRTLTLAAVISGLTIPADWTACYWTVKRSTDDLDADALVQILVSNPADPDDGTQILMGDALDDESDGSLVVNQALGTVTIALGDASTALLEDAVELVWDVKVHAPGGKTQPGSGTATITTAVTRA